MKAMGKRKTVLFEICIKNLQEEKIKFNLTLA